ncbi:MAG: NADH-quinone oxidoreductase subunit H [Acidobacteriota bacterium]|nr:NADH-quinone oxidoreductase subunit H [Blastocatellia bacterium]MDW8412087.1 NADH-quinone oxidoreductase subunit H [Acidobacteriota bacterium]
MPALLLKAAVLFLWTQHNSSRSVMPCRLQLVADLVKILTKQEVISTKADVATAELALSISIAASAAATIALPWWPGQQEVNLLFVLAMAASSKSALMLALSACGSKVTPKIIACEIVSVLPILATLTYCQTLSVQDIVLAQHQLWYILLQPTNFIIYLVCSLATLEAINEQLRAESNCGTVHLWMFSLLSHSYRFFTAVLAVTIFLGGWTLPGINFLSIISHQLFTTASCIIFLSKTALVIYTLSPKRRAFALSRSIWKVVVPVVVLNTALTDVMLIIGVKLELITRQVSTVAQGALGYFYLLSTSLLVSCLSAVLLLYNHRQTKAQ